MAPHRASCSSSAGGKAQRTSQSPREVDEGLPPWELASENALNAANPCTGRFALLQGLHRQLGALPSNSRARLPVCPPQKSCALRCRDFPINVLSFP